MTILDLSITVSLRQIVIAMVTLIPPIIFWLYVAREVITRVDRIQRKREWDRKFPKSGREQHGKDN